MSPGILKQDSKSETHLDKGVVPGPCVRVVARWPVRVTPCIAPALQTPIYHEHCLLLIFPSSRTKPVLLQLLTFIASGRTLSINLYGKLIHILSRSLQLGMRFTMLLTTLFAALLSGPASAISFGTLEYGSDVKINLEHGCHKVPQPAEDASNPLPTPHLYFTKVQVGRNAECTLFTA